MKDLEDQGLQHPAPVAITLQSIKDYATIRNALAEITTTCIVLICGYLIFQSATPGIILMAGPEAEMQAHQRAVENFWLGQQLGSAYYGVLATKLTLSQIVFTGTHRRRLNRLFARLEQATGSEPGLARNMSTRAGRTSLTSLSTSGADCGHRMRTVH